MRLGAIPKALGLFCDILGGVGAAAAGGGALPVLRGALKAFIGAQGLAETLRRRGASDAAEALDRFAARARADWRGWTQIERMEAGAAEAAIADFDAYVAQVGEALAPAPERIAALRADLADGRDAQALARALAGRLAAEMLAEAALQAPDFYADLPERAPSRRFLVGLARGALAALFADPAFAAALQPAMLDLIAHRMGALGAGQDDARAEIAREGARTRDAVAALGDDLRDALRRLAPSGLSLPQAEAILRRFGETGAAVDPERIVEVLRGKAAEMRALQARLRDLSGDAPRVSALREAAAELIEAGDFDAARARLSEARRLDREIALSLSERLGRARDSEAATLARLAELARLQLAYAEEAACWLEAFDLAAPGDADARFELARRAVRALTDMGREFGDNASLNRAIVICRETAAPLVPRARDARRWASAQADLGAALAVLGEREHGVETLAAALRAYRAALTVRTREAAPAEWADTLTNIGRVLHLIGAREAGAGRLGEAIAAFEAVLEARPRAADPLGWARVRNHLGNALKLRGQRWRDAALLRRAVECYRAALRVFRRREHPAEWAMAMGNLAAALRTLGAWEREPALLRAAVRASRAALALRRRDRAPLDWAMTQSALANALQTLGQITGDAAATREAAGAYAAALEVRRRDVAPIDWAMSRGNLGVARLALAERALDAEGAAPAPLRRDGSARRFGARFCLRLARRDLSVAAQAMRAAEHAPYAAYYAERVEEAQALAAAP